MRNRMVKCAAMALLVALFLGLTLLLAWAEVRLFVDMARLQAAHFYLLRHEGR